MTLLSMLRSMLGLGDDAPHRGGTTVKVEAESERAVKAPVERESPAEEAEPVDALSGIGPAYATQLEEAGVATVADLAAADPAALDDATGLGEGRLAGWIEQARER